jgi:hypothetical protein
VLSAMKYFPEDFAKRLKSASAGKKTCGCGGSCAGQKVPANKAD